MQYTTVKKNERGQCIFTDHHISYLSMPTVAEPIPVWCEAEKWKPFIGRHWDPVTIRVPINRAKDFDKMRISPSSSKFDICATITDEPSTLANLYGCYVESSLGVGHYVVRFDACVLKEGCPIPQPVVTVTIGHVTRFFY